MINNIGLFIKTRAKDHEWLKWCLLSIKQNTRGFAGVCIVTDSDHTHINEYESLIKDINGKIVFLGVPDINVKCQDGTGYIWMQNIKLLWYKYCDFDSVLQIDSDCIVSSYLSPNYFIKNNQYKWFVRNWAASIYAQIHRQPLYKLLLEKTKYEHMPFNGWILTRQDTINYHEWLNKKHNCSWWQYLINQSQSDWGNNKYDPHIQDLGIAQSRGSSVYNAYGGFIETTNNNRYVLIDIDDIHTIDHPIKQYWSWGGLSINIKDELLSYLINSDINNIINDSNIELFDENFYILQNPNAYEYINYITENLTNKQKLFYHYKIFNSNKRFYINRKEYELSVFGSHTDMDTDFDHDFYATQYPETASYLSSCPYPISQRRKLYHHYINYGKKLAPPFAKNNIELAKRLTNITQDIPLWFRSQRYEMLCPEVESYCMPHWSNIPKVYRYYHHYLHYGQHNHQNLIDSYHKE